MTERTLFPLAPFLPHWPLRDHPFYQWLLAHETEGERSQGTLQEYLKELGFDIAKHSLDSVQLDTLHHAEGAYHDLWMPKREPQAMGDLFRLNHVDPLSGNHGDLYWIRYPNHQHQYGRPTSKLVDLIDKAAPVYPLHPDHYYFEVIHHTLFIKYQYILGSRRLCPIKEAT